MISTVQEEYLKSSGVSGECSIVVCLSAGVDCLCLLCKSKSQIATALAFCFAQASHCAEYMGLLVAQAMLQKQCAGSQRTFPKDRTCLAG